MAVEYVQILDCLVHFTVFEIAQAIPVLTFQQHTDERMEEMQVFGCRIEREREAIALELAWARDALPYKSSPNT